MSLPRVPALLAPAGGRPQFLAALASGADEVYVGLKSFSARASAENFTTPDLGELIPLAHRYGMKVLVAFNTVVAQTEIKEAFKIVADAFWLGIDGLIVQDLGIAQGVRKVLPNLPLHASTQMAVHDKHGALFLARSGFKRVVLAREMTLAEIGDVARTLKEAEVETEIFCHGSLCYSMSGICLFGGVKHGRSGNRGLCPYPCRHSYTANGGQKHLFNMRDLETEDILGEMLACGVDVLKIEGRKKDAQYVASTIAKYRMALDNLAGVSTLRPSAPESARTGDLLKLSPTEGRYSFQRSTTNLFLGNRRPCVTLNHQEPAHIGVPCARHLRLSGCTLHFETTVDLEQHDGLMLKIGSNWQQGFSCPPLFVKNRIAHRVGSGVEVSLELPRDVALSMPTFAHQKALPPLELYKTRSNRLRAAVDQLTKGPAGERLRFLRPLSLALSFSNNNCHDDNGLCTLSIQPFWRNRLLPLFQMQLSASNRSENFKEAAASLFSILGDAKFLCEEISIEIKESCCSLPSMSELKRAKRDLTKWLTATFEEEQNILSTHLYEASCSFASARLEPSSRDETQTKLFCFVPPHRKPLRLLANFNTKGGLAVRPILQLEESSVMVIENLCAESKEYLNETPFIAMPSLAFNLSTEDWRKTITALGAEGYRRFVATNFWNLKLLTDIATTVPLEIQTSYLFPVWNTSSINTLLETGVRSLHLSPEDSLANLTAIASDAASVEALMPYLFGFPPLFTSRNCAFAEGRCLDKKGCLFGSSRWKSITGEDGESYLLHANARCHNQTFSEKPLDRLAWLPALRRAGYRNFTVDLALWNEQDTDWAQRFRDALAKIEAALSH